MIRWLPALLLAHLAVGLPARAQQPAGEPLGVDFEAEVQPADGAARATVTYDLHLDAGAERIPLLGLHFLAARIEGLEASLDGTALDLEAPREQADGSPLFSGHLRLPEPVASAGERELILSYDVVDALRAEGGTFDLVVPVLIVDWPPTTAPPDMFSARLSLPEELSISAAFPTVPRSSEVRDGTRVESFRLQVTPSVVRFRGSVGEGPLLTLGRLVDLGVGLFLLGLVAYGTVRWRRSLGEDDG